MKLCVQRGPEDLAGIHGTKTVEVSILNLILTMGTQVLHEGFL